MPSHRTEMLCLPINKENFHRFTFFSFYICIQFRQNGRQGYSCISKTHVLLGKKHYTIALKCRAQQEAVHKREACNESSEFCKVTELCTFRLHLMKHTLILHDFIMLSYPNHDSIVEWLSLSMWHCLGA